MYYLYDFYQEIQDAVIEVSKANSTLDKFLNESIKFIRLEQVCRIFCNSVQHKLRRTFFSLVAVFFR